ncbi:MULTISPECIES: YjbE family putative metal transport protein [Acetobacter]|nr:YjbE family putative metal transport protein [Acetobacter cerevisiae]GBQ06871.1 integral membrane protein TerC [Acetobacter cerevisiae DSM 14362]
MHGFLDAFSLKALFAFLQVVMIDVTLAGDNAVVIGLVVRSLPVSERRKAIFVGIALAALIRILMALVAVQLLQIIGLTLAGGLLLLWVCWKMYSEMRAGPHDDADGASPPGSFGKAVLRILLADLSMSLDNVLAVAGAAAEHPAVMVAGLVLSVLLMGVAASVIARLLDKYKWISWVGLLIVLGVAIELIVKGGGEVWIHLPFSH